MYITTSRKPSNSTKILARNFSVFLNSIYEPRGKKSIEEVIQRAKDLGFTRIMVVSEQKGNPNKLAFIDLKREWKWVFPFIIFSLPTKYITKKIKLERKETEISFESGCERIAKLFDIPAPTTDDVAKVHVSKDKIIFDYKGEKLVINIKDLLEKRVEDNE